MAVGGAEFAHRRVDGAVDVFDLLGRLTGAAESGVHRDVGLGPEQAAHEQEVVDADVVGFNAGPLRVEEAGRPLVGIAYSIPPVVAGYEVAARPPVDGNAQFLEVLHHARAKALEAIGGHQRDGADVKRARAGAGDLQAPILGIASGNELQREFCVGARERADRYGLAVGGVRPPCHTDLHLRGGIAGQNHAAGVAGSGTQDESRLADTARSGAGEGDYRRMLADPGPAGVHLDDIVASDGPPGIAARSGESGRRGWLGIDVAQEFAVVEHLGPDPGGGRLEVPAQDQFRDGLPGACCVDRDGHRLGRGRRGEGRGQGSQKHTLLTHLHRSSCAGAFERGALAH